MKGNSEGCHDPSTTNVLVLLQPYFSNRQISFLCFKLIHRWDFEQTIHQCVVNKTLWEKQKHNHSYCRQSTGNSTSSVICFGGTHFSHAVIHLIWTENTSVDRTIHVCTNLIIYLNICIILPMLCFTVDISYISYVAVVYCIYSGTLWRQIKI